MFRSIKPFRDWGIFNKILLKFMIVALISSIGIGVISFYMSSKVVRESTQKQSAETLQQISQNISHQMENIEVIAEAIAYNNQIQDILSRSEVSKSEEPFIHQLVEGIMIVYYSSIKFNDIAIYGDNGMLLNVGQANSSQSKQEVVRYLDIARAGNGSNVWVNDSENYDSLQLLKEVRNIKSMKSLGVVRISVKINYIRSLLQDVDFSTQGHIVLLDENGWPVIQTQSNAGDLAALYEQSSGASGSFEMNFGGQNSLVIYEPIFNGKLSIYGIIPLNKLYQNVNQLKWSTAVVTIIACIIAFVLAHQLARGIVRPINSMLEPMKAASRGEFGFKLPVNSRDEIGQLRTGYNAMTSKISSLIVDVYKEELLKKESEFRALQAQINPHFLYNTLDTINWMATLANKEDISRMVMSVSRLMRISASNKKRILSVEEELTYIRDYLYIQKTRYRDKLDTFIDVAESMYDLYLPKLIIQPLIENAIVHGLEKKKTRGYVRLRGYLEDELVVFEVSDDGLGIPQEKLALLMTDDAPASEYHTGLGMLTVHKRIQFIFGQEYGLSIRSQEGEGTQITLRIPVSMCNEELLNRIPNGGKPIEPSANRG